MKISHSLKDAIDNLPKTAGVYLFYAQKELIYIGKAINIRDRVKNHFQQPTYKDNLFINKITKIEYLDTDSEIEALVLEAQLIKKHLPKFNVIWKDDKNYFYVAIAKPKDGLPYVSITHQPKKLLTTNYSLRTENIGPFVEGNALKKTLKFLRRVFPFYTSPKHAAKPCTWCHLDLCPGPVRNSPPTGPSGAQSAGAVSNGAGPTPNLVEYKKNLKKLALILQGKRKTVLFTLKKEMLALSEANKFEEAAKTRDKINALQQVLQHTHVIEIQNSKGKSQNLSDEKWQTIWKIFQQILNINPDRNRARANAPKGPGRAVSNGTKLECYDISNIQGKNAVGSMVVFVNGAPDKSQYKKFRIRMKNEPNDIAMLKEVLERRLNHPEWGYPEVMLIDGGIAQLNVAIRAKTQKIESVSKQENEELYDLLRRIRVISIAKGRQELFIEGRPKPIPLKDLPQEIYNLIIHSDDEAHRFAVTYHKKLRKKTLLENT